MDQVFEVHHSGGSESQVQCGDPACFPRTAGTPDGSDPPELGTVWDGDLSGSYVKHADGVPRITKIIDTKASGDGRGMRDVTSYYQTGPDRWVSMAAIEGPNPLLDFRPAAEQACVLERSGMIVVDLAEQTSGHTPCGPSPALQYGVTLDTEGRVAMIGSGDRGGSVGMTTFEYPDVARLELPDPSQVTARSNSVASHVDPSTGYWTIEEVGTTGGPGPTTTAVSPP